MAGRPDVRRTSVNIEAVSFPGDTKERIFLSSTWGKSERFIIVDGGDGTHDPKTRGLSTTPFVKV